MQRMRNDLPPPRDVGPANGYRWVARTSRTTGCTRRAVVQWGIRTVNFLLLIGALVALPATAFAQSCELKIGAMGPMSGGGAQWGLSMKSAAELAAAEANQAGGVKIDGKTCTVSVVSYDSKYTPDGAAAGANALAGDG